MGTNETILLTAQAGIESARGTGVAATRKVYAQFDPSYTRALMTFRDSSGTYMGRRRAAYGREKVSFSVSDIATFEDLPWWLKLAVDKNAAGVTDGGTPPAYEYTFEPDIDTDELGSITLEHGEPGNQYESHQGMVNTLTLRFDSDNDSEPGWMVDADMMFLDWTNTTFTPALTDRETEVILARGTKIYIDDQADAFGDTQLVASLISFSATITNNLHFKAFAEDERTSTPGAVGRGELYIDCQVTMEFNDDDEFALYRNDGTAEDTPVYRRLRLEREGSIVHTTVHKSFTLDVGGFWNSWSRSDREGNLIMTMGLAGYYDIDEGMMFLVNVVNALATLP
jgi:hypothetical protein